MAGIDTLGPYSIDRELRDLRQRVAQLETVGQNALQLLGAGVGQLIKGAAVIARPAQIGATPNDIIYELGSGGQPTLSPPLLQIADTVGFAALANYVRWNSSSKALSIAYAVNRGTGIPGPGYGVKTLAGDRILNIAIYGGKDSDGTTTSHCHAGYLTCTAEADNDGSNELDTLVHLRPGCSTRRSAPGAGNGLQMNSRMQAAFAGPNRAAFLPGNDFGANTYIGPGSTDAPPLRIDSGDLSTTPVPGAIEYSGAHFLTRADGARAPVALDIIYALTPGVAGVGTGATATVIPGPNSAILTITTSSTVSNGSARLAFAAAFPTGLVVNATARDAATAAWMASTQAYGASSAARNAITIGPASGSWPANATLSFNVLYRGF